jgi:hypothetical protein
MKIISLIAILALGTLAFGTAATPPSITLAGGTYSGPTQIGPITDANAGTKITCATLDGSTPVTAGTGVGPCTNGFALNDPSYFTMGPTGTAVQFCAVVGTSTLTDSSKTCNTYTINAAGISLDSFGYQCQANAVNCGQGAFPTGSILSSVLGAPLHYRVWDAANPFYSKTTAGTNCNWASIESVTAGSYVWTCLDSWMDSIDAYRNGTAPYTVAHPSFQAAYTFGMVPCTEVTLPGPYTITGVTATTGGGAGINNTTTYSGSFGTTTLMGLYINVASMNNSSNNIGASTAAAITSWSSSSIQVTGWGGVVDLSANTGSLTAVPGPKGCGIIPADLPLSAGSPWSGVPPSPGGSTSFNNFVTALVNRCSAAHPTHCFYNEFSVVESWNEPNNNFFCTPGFCSMAQVYQMLQVGIPIIRAKMTGSGGTNKVVIQSIAPTAAAPSMSTILALESANGVLSDFVAFHQYLGSTSSGLPEDNIAQAQAIMAKRSAAFVSPFVGVTSGFINSAVRLTETGYQSNISPYGCTAPWTVADCAGQLARWQILMQQPSQATGVDWYNLDTNVLGTGSYQTAYYYSQVLLNGETLAACTNAGSAPFIYQCAATESNGTVAKWVWLKCPNDGTYSSCSANGASFTVPAGFIDYRDLNGSTIPVTPGGNITVTVKPVMLEQANTTPAPPPPANLMATLAYLFRRMINAD